VVSLGNPLNDEAGVLRPSLVPGMLGMLANNLNRNVSDVQLYEMGTVFSGDAYRVEERPALALGATGVWPNGPHSAARALDYFDLKGALEDLLAKFAARDIYFDAFPEDPLITPSWLHPYRCARVVAGGETVAWIGQLHPDLVQQRKFKQDVFAGEVYLDRLYRLPLRQPIAREQSRFQPVRRDFSFIFPQSVHWANIAEALENLRLAELSRFAPREIFHDGKGKSSLPAGHYSMLIGVTFQALDRTLREEELQEYSLSIRTSLEKIGGKLRG
jgi:phenylalanyl-tRNA synthetase beta chain